MEKKVSRLRRARKSRCKMRDLGAVRLSVYKSNKYIYAQIIEFGEKGDKILASASTKSDGSGKGQSSASIIGKSIAEKALEKGVKKVAFDRSGYPYHGRVRCVAEAAREAGLDF